MKNDFSIKTIQLFLKANRKSTLILSVGILLFWILHSKQERGDFHNLDTAESIGIKMFGGVYFDLPNPFLYLTRALTLKG